MSIIAGLMDPEMSHSKKSFHRRNDSGELDVFEAARYFSGYNEAVSYNAASSTYTQKILSSERHHHHRGRISLDMPMRSLLPQQFHGVVVDQKQMIMKDNNNNNNNNNNSKKKHNKQPSSPGGRLASFLNSLFSQSASKKKKSSKSSSTQSMKDELDESPGGRRRRRSSISHFRFSSTAAADSKSMYSSSLSSSGFRTPPYVVQTPTKSCKEFRATSAKPKQAAATTTLHKTVTTSNAELSERQRSWISDLAEKEKRWLDKYKAAEEEDQNKGGIMTRLNEEVVDDGADSDSSSDLFELQNYDLGSGLPVYETTNMDNIKRGVPIPN